MTRLVSLVRDLLRDPAAERRRELVGAVPANLTISTGRSRTARERRRRNRSAGAAPNGPARDQEGPPDGTAR